MIRKAKLEDLEQIWNLRIRTTQLLKQRHIDQWQYANPSKERFIKDISDQSFFVYEKANIIVGMVCIMKDVEETYLEIDGRWNYNLPYATIHRFAVDQDFLGQGISDELMVFSKAYVKSGNIHVIRIDTHEQNKQAQRLFEKHGFLLCGTIMLAKETMGDRMRLAFDIKLGD